MGNPADMPPPRQFSDLDQWHIGKPDIVISMPKPYKLPRDRTRRVHRRPGRSRVQGRHVRHGRRDQARSAGASRSSHHITTNLIEDEDDPTGPVLQRVRAGQERRHLPARLRPSDQGRVEDQFQPAPASVRRGDADVQRLARVEAVPEGRRAEVRGVHAAHGRRRRSRPSGRRDDAQRRLLPAAEAGADLGVPAAHAQPRQGAVHGGDLSRTFAPIRRGPGPRGPRRSAA